MNLRVTHSRLRNSEVNLILKKTSKLYNPIANYESEKRLLDYVIQNIK